jgi:hypothetical protein
VSPVRYERWERARLGYVLAAPGARQPARQSYREPDGTGLGWVGGHGTPHVSKQPLAAYGDKRFGREAHEVSSRTFIAHIRFASTGALDLYNTDLAGLNPSHAHSPQLDRLASTGQLLRELERDLHQPFRALARGRLEVNLAAV